MNSVFDPRRRQLFRGDVRGKKQPNRPPWSVDELAFVEGCTRCGDCVRACPEAILKIGSGGFPEVDFTQGECSFCGECVEACQAPVFRDLSTTPWSLKAGIADSCLAYKQIVCRSCGEHCETEAIRFRLQPQSVAKPEIDLDRCTGCGACLSVCPSQAIAITPSSAISPSMDTSAPVNVQEVNP